MKIITAKSNKSETITLETKSRFEEFSGELPHWYLNGVKKSGSCAVLVLGECVFVGGKHEALNEFYRLLADENNVVDSMREKLKESGDDFSEMIAIFTKNK